MGRIRKIINKIIGKKEQQGTIYLKPSEASSAPALSEKTGVSVTIPSSSGETKVYTPSTGWTSSSSGRGGGGGYTPSPTSPTGYADTSGQPVSVAPTAPIISKTPTTIQQQFIQQQQLQRTQQQQYQPKRETISYQPNKINYNEPLTQEPYIKKVQTGEFKSKGKTIPEYSYVYKKGEKSRPATAEEIAYLESQTNVLQASEETPRNKVIQSVSQTIAFLNERARVSLTEPVIGGTEKVLSKATGTQVSFDLNKNIELSNAVNYEDVTKYISQKTKIPKVVIKPFEYSARAGLTLFDVLGSAGVSQIQDIRKKPIKNIAIYGIGFGIGAGIPIVSATSSILGKTGYSVITAGINIAGIGAGTYYAGKTGYEILTAKDLRDVGKTIGTSIKDVGLFGAGTEAGSKIAQQVSGYISTRGRTKLEVPQGVYPQAPINKQLELFNKNIIKEIGEKPVALHTTSDIFYKKGRITPQPGTSELPGLYGSTLVSVKFARIPGSTGKEKLSFLYEGYKSPGIAGLKPKGFRYSPAIKVPSKVGEQKFGWSWKKPAKPGYADVPGIKQEIESIFRVEAGNYALENAPYSQKYYTTISGIRVPIDVFVYEKNIVGLKTTSNGKVNLYGGSSSYGGIGTSSATLSTLGLSGITKREENSYINYKKSNVISKSYMPSTTSGISYTSLVSGITSGTSSRKKSSSLISSGVSSVISKVSSDVGSSSKKSISKSSIYKPVKSSTKSSRSIIRIYSGITKPHIYKFKPIKQQKVSTGKFPVYLRRFGKFKIIGFGKTPGQAIGIGKKATERTLAATFKVPKTKPFKIYGFKTKQEKEGQVYIEKIGRRLKKEGASREVPEILSWKFLKNAKRRKSK